MCTASQQVPQRPSNRKSLTALSPRIALVSISEKFACRTTLQGVKSPIGNG